STSVGWRDSLFMVFPQIMRQFGRATETVTCEKCPREFLRLKVGENSRRLCDVCWKKHQKDFFSRAAKSRWAIYRAKKREEKLKLLQVTPPKLKRGVKPGGKIKSCDRCPRKFYGTTDILT